ncbi:MAG: hypothetical protein HYX72_09930 [Acidobacteria bacterium]|nr:hypothetical protein [Acidobacteriota bacterium]
MSDHVPPLTDSSTHTDPLEELRDRIDFFLLGLRRPVLTEPGKEIIDLSTGKYSLSTEYNKLLLHAWDERTNIVRQITGIHKETPGRMELRFQKFGKGTPGVLIIGDSRAGPEQLERRGARARYAQQLRRYLAQLFPEWKAEGFTSQPDLRNSLSGLYTRGVLVRGQQAWAVIGVGEEEDQEGADNILTYGLIWLDYLRRHEARRVFEGLRVFAPAATVSSAVQRLAWLNSNAARYEVYDTGADVRRCDPAEIGNLRTRFALAGGSFALTPSARTAADRQIERIASLSRDVEIHSGPGEFRHLTLRGLPFAKETPVGIAFGVGRAETLFHESNFRRLRKLIEAISRYRRAESAHDPEARLHPYYRLQPEKWMHSMVVRQIRALGCDLVPDVLYEQVPAVAGAESGLIDLLGVTSQGRLVVVELKASEDIHLPLQALDYWMRVRWQQERGELERQGYFPQRVLSSEPPLLLLVSPALQFHPACEIILRYFAPSIETIQLGLNENWREQLQVVFRATRQPQLNARSYT